MTERTEAIRGVRTRLTVPPEPTRRSFDERLFVRFPGLLRALAAAWSRLPPRSWLRRAWLKRLGARAPAAGNRRDFEMLVLLLDPEVEWDPRRAGQNLARLPDLQGVRRGHSSYVGIWEAMIDAYPDMRLQWNEIIDFGDQTLTVARLTGHGSATGITMDEDFLQLFTLRRGMVIREQDFGDLESALEAAAQRD